MTSAVYWELRYHFRYIVANIYDQQTALGSRGHRTDAITRTPGSRGDAPQ
jgi:hypothetical protein